MITCKICKKEYKKHRSLGTHVKSHSMTPKQYYDKYEKKKDEGKCLNCKKQTEFSRSVAKYRKFCSVKCSSNYKKENRLNKIKGLAPWNKGLTKNTDKRIKRISKNISKAKQISKKGKGKLHYNWQGGKSFESYGIKFNYKLKEKIRIRDKRRCRECNYSEKKLGYKLDVHHINYNKKNNKESNLVSLCHSCHSQTNYNRKDWKTYFKEKVA